MTTNIEAANLLAETMRQQLETANTAPTTVEILETTSTGCDTVCQSTDEAGRDAIGAMAELSTGHRNTVEALACISTIPDVITRLEAAEGTPDADAELVNSAIESVDKARAFLATAKETLEKTPASVAAVVNSATSVNVAVCSVTSSAETAEQSTKHVSGLADQVSVGLACVVDVDPEPPVLAGVRERVAVEANQLSDAADSATDAKAALTNTPEGAQANLESMKNVAIAVGKLSLQECALLMADLNEMRHGFGRLTEFRNRPMLLGNQRYICDNVEKRVKALRDATIAQVGELSNAGIDMMQIGTDAWIARGHILAAAEAVQEFVTAAPGTAENLSALQQQIAATANRA